MGFASLFGLSQIFRRLDEFDSTSTFVVPLQQRLIQCLISLSTCLLFYMVSRLLIPRVSSRILLL